MRFRRAEPRASASTGIETSAAVDNGGGVGIVDAPESDPARDLLGRVGFARRVAATVAEHRGSTSVVVGLYGPWGDGKTTLLGFIASELRANERVRVIQFNPWFYAGEAQIFDDFLEAVAKALGTSLRKMRERVGRAVQQKVGPAAQSVSVGMGPVSTAGNAIGAAGGLLGNPSLRTLRDRIEEMLADETLPGYGKRIVVLMDDIDRLDADQVATVFRMIKLAADFSRLSFLLAFDPKVVANALSARYAYDSHHNGTVFLEKIVQVPLVVPKADPSRVAAILNQWLADCMATSCPSLPFEEVARLQRAMILYVWPRTLTLRSGKRLLSTVQFVIPLMLGEVSPVDQVLLEALRLLYPDLYALVAHSKSLVLYPLHGDARTTLQQRVADAIGEGAPEEAHISGQGLLQELFPHLRAFIPTAGTTKKR
jgi:predicted KAP-like P-loop ATPase